MIDWLINWLILDLFSFNFCLSLFSYSYSFSLLKCHRSQNVGHLASPVADILTAVPTFLHVAPVVKWKTCSVVGQWSDAVRADVRHGVRDQRRWQAGRTVPEVCRPLLSRVQHHPSSWKPLHQPLLTGTERRLRIVIVVIRPRVWRTGIRGLMRGMATLPQDNQELLVVRDKVGRRPG